MQRSIRLFAKDKNASDSLPAFAKSHLVFLTIMYHFTAFISHRTIRLFFTAVMEEKRVDKAAVASNIVSVVG